ncbi:hypothetical protein HK104_002284 [Borealophlyctis nickersoniae]|nr:hypothetical protein HK104_002284 [Borealophlyctis nickersoniae]
MHQRTTRTAPLPPELLREVVLVTDQRTVLTLRHSSKLCKLFADEVILSYSARHPDNIKITLSALVDAQTPSPTTPPVQSVEYVGSQAWFDLKRGTVTVDLVLAARTQTVPSNLTWLPKHINALTEMSKLLSDNVDHLIRIQKMRSGIRDMWRDVTKRDDDAVSLRKSLRKQALEIGTSQLTYQKGAARVQRDYNKAAAAGFSALLRATERSAPSLAHVAARLRRKYNKAAGAGFSAFLRAKERFAPFLVPVAPPSQTLTLTAKGRGVIRARTRPALGGDGIPSLISGTVIRHPRPVQEEDQLQGGGGGDDQCRGGDVRVVMAGFKRGEKMEVFGFRMEMNVASALFLGGFDAMKASVDSSTAAAVST